MEKPFVSVIVPCYNQAQYLEEAIQSVLAQTYSNWECIIINDGSPDNTEEVALKLVKSDSRIQYYKKENGGISIARNFAIAKAAGEYILPLDADDKIESSYIERAVQAITARPDIKVVHCETEFFGEVTGTWNLPEFSLAELAGRNLIVCTALFRKQDWERIGGFDVNMKTGYEDWEFWISLLKNGGAVVKLPYIGFYYRIKNNSRNASVVEMQKRELETYICKKHFEFIIQQLGNPIYLSQELKASKQSLQSYKQSLEYISNKLPYRLYKKMKALF